MSRYTRLFTFVLPLLALATPCASSAASAISPDYEASRRIDVSVFPDANPQQDNLYHWINAEFFTSGTGFGESRLGTPVRPSFSTSLNAPIDATASVSSENGGTLNLKFVGDSRSVFGDLYASLSWHLRLSGAASNAAIPVSVDGLYSYSGPLESFVFYAGADLYLLGEDESYQSVFSGRTTPGDSAFASVVMLKPNVDYQVMMSTSAQLGIYEDYLDYECDDDGCYSYSRQQLNPVSNASFEMTLDPVFTVANQYQQQYQLQTSYSGLGSISAVIASGTPEPAEWALLLAGFGAVGASIRRKRSICYSQTPLKPKAQSSL